MKNAGKMTLRDVAEAMTKDRFVAGVMKLDAEDPTQPTGDGGTAKTSGAGGKFSGTLFNGAVVQRWYGRLAFDVSGIELPGGPIPLLLDHGDAEWPNLGSITSATLDGKAIKVSGTLLTNETAQKVKADAKDGFPWQMSMGVDSMEVESLGENVTAQVNGETITGPCYLVRKCRLREGSVVRLGADAGTGAEMLNKTDARASGDIGGDDMDFTKLTVEDLTEKRPDIVASLRSGGSAAPVPATVDELKGLPGASSDFVVEQLSGKATLDKARAVLLTQLAARAAAAEKDKAEAVEALNKAHAEQMTKLTEELEVAREAAGLPRGLGSKSAPTKSTLKLSGDGSAGGTKLFEGCTGKDPEQDWTSSEALRNEFNGSKTAFMSYAKSCQQRGVSYATA